MRRAGSEGKRIRSFHSARRMYALPALLLAAVLFISSGCEEDPVPTKRGGGDNASYMPAEVVPGNRKSGETEALQFPVHIILNMGAAAACCVLGRRRYLLTG